MADSHHLSGQEVAEAQKLTFIQKPCLGGSGRIPESEPRVTRDSIRKSHLMEIPETVPGVTQARKLPGLQRESITKLHLEGGAAKSKNLSLAHSGQKLLSLPCKRWKLCLGSLMTESHMFLREQVS